MSLVKSHIVGRWKLDWLYDVDASSPTNNQLLSYNSTSLKWEPLTITGAVGPWTLTQNSDTLILSHDGENASIKWSDGDLGLMTDEGTDTNTYVSILGKGTGFGVLEVYDTDEDSYITLGWKGDDQPTITTDATPSEFNLLHDRPTDIKCWSSIISGNPYFYIYGYKTADAVKYLRQRVEADGDALIQAEGNLNILADGGAITFGNENLSTSGTLGSGELTVDSGASCSIKIKGTSTGNANLGWIGFYDSNGTTRRGYVGDGSSNDDDIYLEAETGRLTLIAAEYINLRTHTYFLDNVVMSFGASLDYSIGYYSTDDEFQIVDGSTLDSNVRLKLDSSGHFDFGAGNLTTTGTLNAGQTTLGDGGTTNYASFAADGELNLFGTARVLKQIPIANANLGKGSTAPSQVILGNYNGWEYTIGDDTVFTFHLPHNWASGTDVVINIDWYIDEAGGDEIKWRIDWAATPHTATEAVDAPTHTGNSDTGDIVVPATVRYLTQDALTIPGASLTSNDQVGVKISRVAITDGTNPGNDPAIIDLHIEYTVDTLGEATT